jgi:hypothetical protein
MNGRSRRASFLWQEGGGANGAQFGMNMIDGADDAAAGRGAGAAEA